MFQYILTFAADGENPFKTHPSFTQWAPWIGRSVRGRSVVNTEYRSVVNTEYLKTRNLSRGGEEDVDPDMSAISGDRLMEMLTQKSVSYPHTLILDNAS